MPALAMLNIFGGVNQEIVAVMGWSSTKTDRHAILPPASL